MGKKRKKKSKGRKKRQNAEASPKEVTPEVDVVAEVSAEPPSPVDAVIDLDEDLDDPLARAELVAAVAGLEVGSETEDGPDDHGDLPPDEQEGLLDDEGATDDAPVSADDAPTEGDPSSAQAGEASADAEDARDATDGVSPPASVSDIEGAGEPDTDAAYGVTAAEEERPLIGPDALVALSEFRQEGVATLPEELVLDLGDATTPEERDRLLAAALAHVEMQDAIYRVPLESGASRRWKGLIASAVFLFAIVLVGLPPAFLVPEAPPPLTVAETGGGIRMALLMQAEQIEAFRARSGRLPSSIAEVETALPGVRYVRSSNRLYQLIAYTPAGDAVIYDSSSPDPSFAAAEEAWSRLMGDS